MPLIPTLMSLSITDSALLFWLLSVCFEGEASYISEKTMNTESQVCCYQAAFYTWWQKNSFVSCFQFPASHLPHIPSSKLLPSNPLIFNRHFQEHNSTQQPAASPSGKLPPSTSTCSTPCKCSSMPRSVSLLQAVPRLKATGRWIAQPEVTQ